MKVTMKRVANADFRVLCDGTEIGRAKQGAGRQQLYIATIAGAGEFAATTQRELLGMIEDHLRRTAH